MSKTLSNLRTLFLAKINQESNNNSFGNNYTTIDLFLNEAYREIAQETGVCRFREALTLTSGDETYIIGTDILSSKNSPRILSIVDYENVPLKYITEAEYAVLSSASGTPYLWTLLATYSGSPTAMVRTVYFYPTPSSADVLYILAEILPSELSATTDIPIWDEVYGLHNIIADVAVAKALQSIGDLRYASYDMKQDDKVRQMKFKVAEEWMPENRDPGPIFKRRSGYHNDYPHYWN